MVPLATRMLRVEVPEEALAGLPSTPGAVEARVRLLLLIDQVRERRLGYGKAAELAEMPILDFVREMGAHGVSPFDYDDADLAAELGAPA